MLFKKRHLEKLNELTDAKEEWASIPGYDNYLVSNLGHVFSFTKNDFMVGEETDKGYLRVNLRDNEGGSRKIRIHRLVAEAFLPNPEGKTQVDHKNGVKVDNRLSNLRWLSNAENQIAAVQKGGRKTKTNQSAQYRLKERQKKFAEKREAELAEIKERMNSSSDV